jgi:hypothetical protein
MGHGLNGVNTLILEGVWYQRFSPQSLTVKRLKTVGSANPRLTDPSGNTEKGQIFQPIEGFGTPYANVCVTSIPRFS